LSKVRYKNKRTKNNIVFSIAGAHGVGKSTIVNLMKQKYENNKKFKFFPERYVKNPPFPFGSTNKQIAFRSEIHFLQQLIRRNRNVVNFDNKYKGKILILDRTPICVLIYSKSLYLKEKDFQLIYDTYKSIKWREDYVIYLTATIETILKRIIQRGSLEKIRREWNETERDYLNDILINYKKYLLNSEEYKNKVFVIDTDSKTPEQVVNEIESIITRISGYEFDKTIKQPPTQMSILKFL